MTSTLRIVVDDHPGALARIAATLAETGANIVELDVLERSVDRAVDRIVVEAPGVELTTVTAAIDALPGAHVESATTARRHIGLPPLGLAVRMSRARTGTVAEVLVDGVTLTFEASWAAVLHQGPGDVSATARSSGAPLSLPRSVPWLPLRDVRNVPVGGWVPSAWQRGADLELAAAPIRTCDEAVLVARVGGPRFASRELGDLGMLADLAGALTEQSAAVATQT